MQFIQLATFELLEDLTVPGRDGEKAARYTWL